MELIEECFITVTDICSFLIEALKLNNMKKDNKNTELNSTNKKLHISDVSCSFCGCSNFGEYKLNVRKKTKVYSNGLEQYKDDVIKIRICECGVIVKNDN